jgi:hypothetical protein
MLPAISPGAIGKQQLLDHGCGDSKTRLPEGETVTACTAQGLERKGGWRAMEWSHDLPWQTSAATPTPKGLVEYHRENGHHRRPPANAATRPDAWAGEKQQVHRVDLA